MHARYRRTGPPAAAPRAAPGGAAASRALRASRIRTLPSRVFPVEPEPQRIPEVFRPVEARRVAAEVVVIQQRRSPAEQREIVFRESPQECERLGGGRG